MGDVVVISKSIVRPESYNEESDRVKIHLTPWDLIFLRSEYPQRGLLFPQPDPETHIISQLKSSLSVALKIFYPFAGRLVKTENEDDGTASFFIDCDGSGVKFIHASAKTISVSDVLEPADGFVPEFLNRFFPVNEVRSCEGMMKDLGNLHYFFRNTSPSSSRRFVSPPSEYTQRILHHTGMSNCNSHSITVTA